MINLNSIIKYVTIIMALGLTNIIMAAQEVIIMTDPGYPPYGQGENDDAKGIYADMMRAVAEKITDYKIKVQGISWKRGISMIESGEGLAIAGAYRRTKERPWMDPYSELLNTEQVVILCDKEVFKTSPRANYPNDYFGLRFVQERGFLAAGSAFYDNVKLGSIQLAEVNNFEQAVTMVLLGKADCVVNDKIAIEWELHEIKSYNKLVNEQIKETQFGNITSSEQAFVGFSKNNKSPFKEDFIKKVNQAIIDLKLDGSFKNIINKYIK